MRRDVQVNSGPYWYDINQNRPVNFCVDPSVPNLIEIRAVNSAIKHPGGFPHCALILCAFC